MIETKERTLNQVWDEWLTARGVHPQLFVMHRKYGITEGRQCRECDCINCEIEVTDGKWQACGRFEEREDDEADD